jgi:hypothetical protein
VIAPKEDTLKADVRSVFLFCVEKYIFKKAKGGSEIERNALIELVKLIIVQDTLGIFRHGFSHALYRQSSP